MSSFIKAFKHIKGAVLYGVLVSSAAGAIFGYATGIISAAYDNMNDPSYNQSILVTSIVFGAFLGSSIAGFISFEIGPKKAILLHSFICLVGNTLLTASIHPWMGYIGRTILGYGLGGMSSIGPGYQADTSPKEYRGMLGTFFQFWITFTIVLANIPFFVTAPNSWRWMFGLTFIPIVFLLAIGFFIPESPRALVMRGDIDKAKEVFNQIYSSETEIEEEISEIQRQMDLDVPSWWTLIKGQLDPLFLCVVIAAGQQLTGVNAIIYYFKDIIILIFKGKVTNNQVGLYATLLLGWNCLVAMASIFLVSRFGRRRLMLLGLVIIFVSLLITALSFMMPLNVGPYITIFSLAMFFLGFEISVGPIFFIIVNEIFEERMRGRVGAMMTGVNWLFNIIISVSFTPVNEALENIHPNKQDGYVFYIFTTIALFVLVFLYFKLPETKGLSFNEIQLRLKGTNRSKILKEDKKVKPKEVSEKDQSE